jgi:hypothetical protein
MMRALHGSANALGFGLCGLLGHHLSAAATDSRTCHYVNC